MATFDLLTVFIVLVFCRVVAVDMRGYGESDKPRGRDAYRMERLVDDVRQIIDKLGMWTLDCVR